MDKNYTERAESCYSEREGCLIELNKKVLWKIKSEIYISGAKKDFLMLESILRRNFYMKKNWRGVPV